LIRAIVPILCAITLVGFQASPMERETLVADRAHSSITFTTSHWDILDIVGWFEDYDIEVEVAGAEFADAEIVARIRLDSVRMPNPDMAVNLRGMFSTSDHPEAVFRSTRVSTEDDVHFVIAGEFTLKGVTEPMTWHATLNGFGYPPDALAGFTATGTLSRLDFEVGDRELHNDSLLIGDVVEVVCNIRLVVPGK
jgi:polyisoprenoid-binding protein YceI